MWISLTEDEIMEALYLWAKQQGYRARKSGQEANFVERPRRGGRAVLEVKIDVERIPLSDSSLPEKEHP